MDSKQFTRIAMSILIGLNVGAYYVYWPPRDCGAKAGSSDVCDDAGSAQLLPGKPNELPILTGTVPLRIPGPPTKVDAAPDEAVDKLLDHIKRENGRKQEGQAKKEGLRMPPPLVPFAGAPAKKDELPLPPLVPLPGAPNPLPPIEIEGFVRPSDLDNPNVGVTSPLAPKLPESPWHVRTEKVGTRTLLIAKLHKPGQQPVEFRIQCDRVETKDAEVIATGKVTVAGVGLDGESQRLTLTLTERRLVFEDQVRLVREGDSQLRGERIVWEFPSADPAPIILGGPK